MKVLHNNVLVTEDKQTETKTASGLILSADVTTGNKPAKVIGMGMDIALKKELVAGATVYLDWSKAMPVELDGIKCAIVDYEHVKLIVD